MRTTWLRRLCLVAAIGCFTVAVAGPTVAGAVAPSDTGIELGRPTLFAGLAAASGAHQSVDRNPGLSPTAEPVYGNLADGFGAFSSDDELARASTYYPGLTGTSAPSLVCDQVLTAIPVPLPKPECPPPPYPASVQADATHADAHTPTGQSLGDSSSPAQAKAVYATAHADRHGVFSDAVDANYVAAGTASTASASLVFRRQAALILSGPVAAQGVEASPADSAAVRANGIEAHTRLEFDAHDPALLHVSAIARASGVDLVGGMIHIASLVGTSSYDIDGQRVTKHVTHTTVDGVTVAGQAATIDEHGVTVGGASQGGSTLAALNAALQQALAAAGAQVHLVKTDDSPAVLDSKAFRAVCSAGEGDALLVHMGSGLTKPVPQAGGVYLVDVTLASACTTADASSDRLTAIIDNTLPPEVGLGSSASAAPSQVLGSSSGAVVSGGAPLSPAGSVGSASVGVQSRAVRGARVASAGGFSGFFEDQLRGTVAHRTELLYLSFTLAFAALFLGFRYRLPARFPRGG